MRIYSIVGAALAATVCVPAAASEADADELAGLSIEQLARIQVSSASKRDEPLSQAPTALYVITGEEIAASGATFLPEALRLAPNLQVQQVNASEYSISSRGFNGIQAGNKLLVLIDGRTIYTPLASSVFWNLHSPILEDVQQVEVISGPGGALYGPNAVNGVVNIISRDAHDTIGTLARATAGSGEQTAAIRHGLPIGARGALRLYANWHNRDALPAGTGVPTDDDYSGWQAGFRSDFVTEADHVTIQGDIYRTDADTLSGDGAKGHNILARWGRALNESSSLQLQAYYDRFEREFVLVKDSLTTLDAEAQLTMNAGAHAFIVGGGVRTTRDEFINDLNQFKLDPESRRLWVVNIFAQDRFALTPKLSLVAGLKVERSSFTGWQLLPNVRLAWQASERDLLWASVSRAVRTPSRIDRELGALPILARSTGFDSEKLIAVEAGYRGQPSARFSLSVNGFVNFYNDIRTTELTDGRLPIVLRNGNAGRTYGIEAWGTMQVASWWRMSLGGTTLWKDLETERGRSDLAPRNSLGNDPRWQVKASAYFDLADRLTLTVNGRAVARLKRDPGTDSYVEAGGRLAYQFSDRLDLFVAGRNLLRRNHAENDDPAQGQLAKRSIYAGTRVRF